MDKVIKLKLDVDTKAGKDAIEKLTDKLKGMAASAGSAQKAAAKGASDLKKAQAKQDASIKKATNELAKIEKQAAKARIANEKKTTKELAKIEKQAANKLDKDRAKREKQKLRALGENHNKDQAARAKHNKLLETNKAKSIKRMTKMESDAARKSPASKQVTKSRSYLNKKGLEDETKTLTKLTRELKNNNSTLSKHRKAVLANDKALKKLTQGHKGVLQYLFKLRSGYLAITAAAAIATVTVGAFFKKGFEAVEKFNLSVATLAATITSFAKTDDKDIADVYQNAYNYSTALVEQMEIWNALTLATGENLTAMVSVMAQSGVLIDINNAKQVKGIITISNAIAVMTQGQDQEKQFRQEIRALMAGEARAGSLLAQYIKSRVGDLKAAVTLWKEEEVITERIAEHLKGFSIASADIAKTWAAVKTTLSTMAVKVLRGMFKPIYQDIIKMTQLVNDNLLEQNDTTKSMIEKLETGMYKTWVTIKNIVKSVADIILAFKTPLLIVAKLVSMIADGWGYIFAILPAFANTFKRLGELTFGIASNLQNMYGAFKSIATTFDLKSAKAFYELAKQDRAKVGTSLTQLMSDEWATTAKKGLDEYMAKMSKDKAKWDLPDLDVGNETDELKKREKGIADLRNKLRAEEIRAENEGWTEKKKLFEHETAILLKKYEESSVQYFLVQRTRISEFQQMTDEHNKELADKQKEADDKKIAKAKETAEKLIADKKKIAEFTYQGTELKLAKKGVEDAVSDLLKLAKTEKDVIAIKAAGIRMIKALEEEQRKKDQKAANDKKQRAEDAHEQVLSYISTELDNNLRAIEKDKEAMLEKATTLTQIAAIYEASALKKEALDVKDKERTKAAFEEWRTNIISMTDQWENFLTLSTESAVSGSLGGLWEFIEGTKTANEALKEFTASFAKEVLTMVAKTLMLNAIKSLLNLTTEVGGDNSAEASAKAVLGLGAETTAAGMATAAYLALAAAKAAAGSSSMSGAADGAVVTPNALGNVYQNSQKMMAYANGGVVNSPTTFPIKNGVGIMSEEDPEAIMPLKRGKSGKLGVEAVGAQAQAQAPIYLQMTNITDPQQIKQFMGTRAFKDNIINIVGSEKAKMNRRLM